MSPESMIVGAGIALIAFCAVGTFDGLYYHLIKFELHRRPEAAYEQKLHTIRAFLFAPIGLLVFARNVAGAFLWLAVGLLAADFVVELLDVAAEKRSRRLLGGISSGEYMVHISATSFRMIAIALALAAKPLSAWSLSAPALLSPAYPMWLTVFATGYSAVVLAGGLTYVALSFVPLRVADVTSMLRGLLTGRSCPLLTNPSA